MIEFQSSSFLNKIGNGIHIPFVITNDGEQVAEGSMITTFNNKQYVKVTNYDEFYENDIRDLFNEVGVFDGIVFSKPIVIA